MKENLIREEYATDNSLINKYQLDNLEPGKISANSNFFIEYTLKGDDAIYSLSSSNSYVQSYEGNGEEVRDLIHNTLSAISGNVDTISAYASGSAQVTHVFGDDLCIQGSYSHCSHGYNLGEYAGIEYSGDSPIQTVEEYLNFALFDSVGCC